MVLQSVAVAEHINNLVAVKDCRKCYEAGEPPYMSTKFGDKYQKWARVTKVTMHIQHKPGDIIQVDWAGDTIDELQAGKWSCIEALNNKPV